MIDNYPIANFFRGFYLALVTGAIVVCLYQIAKERVFEIVPTTRQTTMPSTQPTSQPVELRDNKTSKLDKLEAD